MILKFHEKDYFFRILKIGIDLSKNLMLKSEFGQSFI